MSIGEASDLIIKISILGENSKVYLLDMGKPKNLYEIAFNLVKFNGLSIKNKNNPTGDISIKIIGLSKGEKLHEKLITVSDSLTTYDIGNYYLILPQSQSSDLYISHYNSLNLNLLKVEENFTYDSGKNSIFLSDLEIRNLIKLNIKDDFEPI